MHRKLYFVILICLSVFVIAGQDVMMDISVPDKPGTDRFGPNRLHYVSPFIQGGGMLGLTSTELSDQITGTFLFGVGVQYKLKMSSHFDLGTELAIERLSIGINQETGKYFPDTTIVRAQKLVRSSVPLSLFLRGNFGRRGDYIGWHFDMGAYADLGFAAKNVIWTDLENGATRKSKRRGLPMIEGINEGVFVRIGYNKFSLGLRYRLTDFVDQTTYDQTTYSADLSPFTFVMRFGLHK